MGGGGGGGGRGGGVLINLGQIICWDPSKRACCFKISNSKSRKCPLHIASYALRIGVSVIELYDLTF